MPLPLFGYQEEGARKLASRDRFGLFDDPGVGKTATTIRAIDIINGKRGIVVAPAVARENWRKEFAKFSDRYRRIVKGVTIHDYIAWQRERFDVLVASYEQMTKWAARFDREPECLDFIVFDEGHYLKNIESQRSKMLLEDGLQLWGVQAWWLTGTPIPNDPMDIYTFLRFTRCMPLTARQFRDRYFTSRLSTFSSRQAPKPEMVPELRALIGNNSMRRTLEQTGVELPPIFPSTTFVEGNAQHIRDMLAEHPGLDEAIRKLLEEGRPLGALDADNCATLRRLIGEAKAIPYATMLLQELHDGLDKMVVFGLHRQALADVNAHLQKHGIGSAVINGETPERQRDAIVEHFQTKPELRVVICNIRAAGTAITLTAAARLDMLEVDWAPLSNYQAIKRVHRLTQTRSVRVRFVTLAESFDETVNAILVDKTANICQVEGRDLGVLAG